MLPMLAGGVSGLPQAFFSQAGSLAVGITDRAYLHGQQDAIVHMLGDLSVAERAAHVRRCIDELHALESGGQAAPPTGWRGLIATTDRLTSGLLHAPPPLIVNPGRSTSPGPSLSADDLALEVASAAVHARASFSGTALPSADSAMTPSPDPATTLKGRTKSKSKSKSKSNKAALRNAAMLPDELAPSPVHSAHISVATTGLGSASLAVPAPPPSSATKSPATAAAHAVSAAASPSRTYFERVAVASVDLETIGPHGTIRQPHREDASHIASVLYRAAAVLLAQAQVRAWRSSSSITACPWLTLRAQPPYACRTSHGRVGPAIARAADGAVLGSHPPLPRRWRPRGDSSVAMAHR